VAIVYFDSSALVKLVVEEEQSDLAASLWDGADAVVTSGLAYPEVRAALAAGRRSGRLDDDGYQSATVQWEMFWEGLGMIELSIERLIEAGDLAERFALRGGDAVHLASAMVFPRDVLVMAVWDERLRSGAITAGISVAPVSRSRDA